MTSRSEATALDQVSPIETRSDKFGCRWQNLSHHPLETDASKPLLLTICCTSPST